MTNNERISRLSKRALLVSITALVVSISSLVYSGCSFLENQLGDAVSDIEGWDFSACVDSSCGRETCLRLFRDNERMILGGRTTIEVITEQLNNSTSNGIE